MKPEKTIIRLGEKGKQLRIDLELKQDELARNAGVSLSTVKSFEAGKSISLANFAKIISQLGCLENLEKAIPEVAPNPLDLMKLEGKARQRVR